MKEEDVKKFCDKLIEDMIPMMREHVNTILESKALDIEEYPTNYLAPKMIMGAVCSKMERELEPPMTKDKETFKRLKKCL